MKASILNLVLQRMARGYEEQLPYYEEMYKLALEQEIVLQQAEVDTDHLVELIKKRQELIDKVEGLNKEISNLKIEICKALGLEEFTLNIIKEYVRGEGTQELDSAISVLTQVLRKIRQLDQKNEDKLRQRINETKDRLTQVGNTKKANKAYNAKVKNPEGIFIDFSK